MASPIRYKRKVRYADTDALGHVFNANYFVYFDDAITDYMEAAMSGQSHDEAGYQIVLARAECDFRSSGQLGETMVTRATVEKVGNTSLTFALEVVDEASGRLVANGVEVYVVVDGQTMRPIPVPDTLRAAIARLEEGSA